MHERDCDAKPISLTLTLGLASAPPTCRTTGWWRATRTVSWAAITWWLHAPSPASMEQSPTGRSDPRLTLPYFFTLPTPLLLGAHGLITDSLTPTSRPRQIAIRRVVGSQLSLGVVATGSPGDAAAHRHPTCWGWGGAGTVGRGGHWIQNGLVSS